jgi:hypothetical protein
MMGSLAKRLRDGTLVMPQNLRLTPTEKDRRLGVCNSPTKCMYALVLRRLFPDATYVSVNPNCVALTLGGQYHHYTMPKKGVLALARFDNSGKDIESLDLKKAEVTLSLAEQRPCAYVSTEATRKYHREKSAQRRADPDYVRPDSRQTVRAQLARSYSRKADAETPA